MSLDIQEELNEKIVDILQEEFDLLVSNICIFKHNDPFNSERSLGKTTEECLKPLDDEILQKLEEITKLRLKVGDTERYFKAIKANEIFVSHLSTMILNLEMIDWIFRCFQKRNVI